MALQQKQMIPNRPNRTMHTGQFNLTPGTIWNQLKTVKKSKSGRKSGDVWLENQFIEKIRQLGGVFVNDIFLDIWDTKSQLLFLEGSYGSSKTTYAITRKLIKCIESPKKKFKCFYGRQEKTMATQLHSNIIREIERNKWESRFEYSVKPNGTKKIFCLENGNMFELFGCDDPDTLKGIDNPTDILVDEVNQISFEAFGMLLSRLRTSGSDLQFIGCFNPCDVYPDHWLSKFIYGKGNGETDAEKMVLEAMEDLEMVSHHSTYLDNYFQNPDAYLNKLKIQAKGDEERVKDYALGRWGSRLNASPFYKWFKYDVNVYDFLDESQLKDKSAEWYANDYAPDKFEFGAIGEFTTGMDDRDEDYPEREVRGSDVESRSFLGGYGEGIKKGKEKIYYDPYRPLLLSFDDNVQPYLPVIICQRHGNELWIIDEIAAENPDNTLHAVCPMIEERYFTHKSGGVIFGDSTAKSEDTKLEKGANFFTIAQGLLKKFKPEIRVPTANPNSEMRGDFLNVLFRYGYYGMIIKISKKCVNTIEDIQNIMEDVTNIRKTRRKDKKTSMVNGIRQVQRYGHLSDCMDYIVCEEFYDKFALFQNDGISADPTGGKMRRSEADREEARRPVDVVERAKESEGWGVDGSGLDEDSSYGRGRRKSKNSMW